MSKRSIVIAIALVLVAAAPSGAHADELATIPAPDLAHDLEVHATAGMELLGGSHTESVGFRVHVGAGYAIGHGRVRPSFVIGATVASDALFVTDPRALDGALELGYLSYGPEVQLGLRFVDGGHVDSRIYAGIAALRTSFDSRLQLDAVPGVGSGPGFRVALGGTWTDRIVKAIKDHPDGPHEIPGFFAILTPGTAELAWEHDGGSDRFGVMLGYGI